MQFFQHHSDAGGSVRATSSTNLPLPSAALANLYTASQMLSGIAPVSAVPALSALPLSASAAPLGGPVRPYGGLEPFDYSQLSAPVAPALSPSDTQNSTPVATVQAVDPAIFDILLSNEVNRRLKVKFGIAFIVITTVFTLISYALIMCSAIYHWQLPAPALTALVVQAPLQMIGILYIMARHLFPTATLNAPRKPKRAA